MAFEFTFLADAEKQLRALDKVTTKRILKKLSWIAKQENPIKHGKLLHKPAIGDLRFRIGEYRAIAVIDRKRVVIIAVGHRRDIYR